MDSRGQHESTGQVRRIPLDEDFTLPHVSWRNLAEFVGIRWIPPDSTPGLCQCDKGQIGIFSPVESTRIWHNLAKSADFHHTFPVDSGGLVRWIPEDHKIPLDKSNRFHWTYPTDSAGLSPRA